MFKLYKDASEQYLKIGTRYWGLKIEPCYDGERTFGLYFLAWRPKSIGTISIHTGWLPLKRAKVAA
jgi:hypothetical protein